MRSSPRKEVITSTDSLFEQSIISYRLQHHRECNDMPGTDILFKEFCINVNIYMHTVENVLFYVAVLAWRRS